MRGAFREAAIEPLRSFSIRPELVTPDPDVDSVLPLVAFHDFKMSVSNGMDDG
jgi:hypothetical protein